MSKPVWGFIVGGFGCLLGAAYFDNIRGPLLPLMTADLGLAFTDGGWFFAVGFAAATVASLLLIKALNIYSERRIMIGVATLALAVALAAAHVSSLPTLMLLAALVGVAASNLGAMSNVLVLEGAPAASAGRYLSGLHAMFGIGSMAATAAIAFGVRRDVHWSTFYIASAPLVLLLLAFCLKQLRRSGTHAPRPPQSARLSGTQLLIVVTFAVYVAGEVTAAAWMTSYLVNVRALSVPTAAGYVTAYFLVMTLSRGACSLLLQPHWERRVLYAALVLPLLAFAAAFIGGANWALAGVGLYGPFFPVLLTVSSRAFPDRWRTLTVWIMVAMNVLNGVFNVTLGRLADGLGIERAYLLPGGLLVLALILLRLCLRRLGLGAMYPILISEDENRVHGTSNQ